MASRTTARVIDKDRGYDRILRKIAGLDKYSLEVGFFEGSGVSRDVIERAYRNEYGDGPPARPFIAPTVDANYRKYVRALAKRSFRFLVLRRGIKENLETVGNMIARDIERAIAEKSTPANAPATVARMVFNDPLFETGEMQDSVRVRIARRKK